MRFSNGEGLTILEISGGVVDGSWTGILPAGHLLDGCITKEILFLKEPVSEY